MFLPVSPKDCLILGFLFLKNSFFDLTDNNTSTTFIEFTLSLLFVLEGGGSIFLPAWSIGEKIKSCTYLTTVSAGYVSG